jgi:hypothetical protein
VDDSPRYLGTTDIHDGYVREVLRTEGHVYVKIQGDRGRFYMVRFNGVQSIESETPDGMMLYGLAEWDTGDPLLRRYEFVNWYCDEPDTEEFKSRLVIMAAGFELRILTDGIMDCSSGTHN